MAKQAFSVSGAVAAQGSAHARLQLAIANGTAVRILFKGCPYMTAPSAAAAEHILPRKGSPARANYQVVAM